MTNIAVLIFRELCIPTQPVATVLLRPYYNIISYYNCSPLGADSEDYGSQSYTPLEVAILHFWVILIRWFHILLLSQQKLVLSGKKSLYPRENGALIKGPDRNQAR